jgi:hypothetical protein
MSRDDTRTLRVCGHECGQWVCIDAVAGKQVEGFPCDVCFFEIRKACGFERLSYSDVIICRPFRPPEVVFEPRQPVAIPYRLFVIAYW